MRRKTISFTLAAGLALGALLSVPVNASARPQPLAAGKASVAPDIPVSGTFNIHNFNASGKCLGIDGTGLAGDWTCTSNKDQRWHWGSEIGSGDRQLVNGNGQCLAVQNGNIFQGARLVAFTCLGSDHEDQYWAVGQAVPGGTPIYNDVGFPQGWAVGVQGGSTGNGVPVVLWEPDGSNNQVWS